MAEFIQMPKLGFDMREGVLVGWMKEIGEMVNKGDVVAEIESDKATLELESQVSGILLAVLEEADAVVPIGANLAIVGEEGEDVSGMLTDGGDEAEEAPAEESGEASDEPVVATQAAVEGEFPGGVKSTPVARRVAREHGVDLREVNGSGPAGRVRKRDVENYLTSKPAATPAPTITHEPLVAGPESEEVPTTRLRQAIARRMTMSKTTIPHFYVTTEIDVEAALALRKQINAAIAPDNKVSVNDMIVKASALALRDFPNINASFNDKTLIRHNRINVGTAVAVEGGLLTVVQQNTDVTPLAKVASDNREMIGRARSGKVHADDVSGSTFTVSNLGAFDVDHFIAIINPPEATILAVGSAKQMPVVVDGELTIGWRMKVTLSADHRVTDGAEAAQFLQQLKAILEEPVRLLV